MKQEVPPVAAVAIIVVVVAVLGLLVWKFAGTRDPGHVPRDQVMEIWKKAGGAPPPGLSPQQQRSQTPGPSGTRGAAPSRP